MGCISSNTGKAVEKAQPESKLVALNRRGTDQYHSPRGKVVSRNNGKPCRDLIDVNEPKMEGASFGK